jgi:hypothetical protein
MSFAVAVDPTNPGQFFACCGLLELADRRSPGAEGWFVGSEFHIAAGVALRDVLSDAQAVEYAGGLDDTNEEGEDDGDDGPSPPLLIRSPFGLLLNWWEEKGLKTWAGSMKVDLIAAAMSHAIDPTCSDPLNQATVVYDPPKPVLPGKRPGKPKKREPFYFDARRAMNAHSLDVGFSANDLKLTTLAYPAVEFLCLVGLQRSRPRPTDRPRTFDYWTWAWPTRVQVLPLSVAGYLGDPTAVRYRFVNVFRSGQRKHKAFGSATRLPRSPSDE